MTGRKKSPPDTPAKAKASAHEAIGKLLGDDEAVRKAQAEKASPPTPKTKS